MSSESPRNVFLKLSAALLGAAPVALYASMAAARLLPVDDQVRAVCALFLPLPLYVTLACLAARARSGARAWLLCAAALALLLLALR